MGSKFLFWFAKHKEQLQTDEVTLGRSIVNRIPYNNSLAR